MLGDVEPFRFGDSLKPSNLVTEGDWWKQHVKIDLALFGADETGGIVADIQRLRNTSHRLLRQQ